MNQTDIQRPRQWNDLTMQERSDIMGVAVRNGITSLREIRRKWNEFAEGGYLDDDDDVALNKHSQRYYVQPNDKISVVVPQESIKYEKHYAPVVQQSVISQANQFTPYEQQKRNAVNRQRDKQYYDDKKIAEASKQAEAFLSTIDPTTYLSAFDNNGKSFSENLAEGHYSPEIGLATMLLPINISGFSKLTKGVKSIVKPVIKKAATLKATFDNRQISKGLQEAIAYRTSPEYKTLIQKARRESQSLGFGDFPEEAFTYNPEEMPVIINERRPEDHVAAYNSTDNKISYDSEQISPWFLKHNIMHEGLHWKHVGDPYMYIGPKYQKWLNNTDKKTDDALLKDFKSSPEYNVWLSRTNADDYLSYKVQQALKPTAANYLRETGELQVNGLEAGAAIGLKPFTPYPGRKKAEKSLRKAIKYNDYLRDLKSASDTDIQNVWNILTGQYTPTLIPIGIGGTLISVYPNKQ